MTRLRLSDPYGYQVEFGITYDHPNERKRRDVFDPDGNYIGEIVYVRRPLKAGGSQYGWRPADNARVKLTTQGDAVRRLRKFTA